MEHHVFKYKSLISTNLEAETLLRKGEISEFCFVTTDFQTNGRGRGENVWNSLPGENLLFSWIVFPAFLSVSRQFQLSKAISLAIIDYLDTFLGGVSVKWPNDIFCEDKKICGILIDNSVMGSSLKHSIVGVGLNVNQINFPEFSYSATSMRKETDRHYDLENVQSDLFSLLRIRYEDLASKKSDFLDEAYLSRLYKLDEVAEFRDQYANFQGVIRGVSDIGELMVQSECGIRNYGFHEIKMLHSSH